MKKLFIACLIALLGTGCFGGPLKNFLGIQKKEDKTEQKIDKNKDETIEKARQFVHGTGTALQSDPSPSRYSEVAYGLNKRAEIVLGPPNYKEALEIDKIVAGLLSTNTQIKIDAQKSLDKKDNEIVGLQAELNKLQVKLGKIEEEKDKISLENSVLGQKWHSLIKWIKWIFWGIVIGIILAVVSQILSVALPPPYNGIFSIVALIVGGIGKMLFKLVPNAKSVTGVIDKKIHETSEKTLHSLVDAIEVIRNQEIKPEDIAPQSHNVKIKDIIDQTLLEITDKDTREKILDIKKKLNLV